MKSISLTIVAFFIAAAILSLETPTNSSAHGADSPAILPTGVIDLWGGAIESIALRSDGTVWAWGWDEYGVLGNGHGPTMLDLSTLYDSWVPFQVLGHNGVGHLASIQSIAGGERHNAALDFDGKVWMWGWNYFGQLGTGTVCSGMNNPDCMSTTPVMITDTNFISSKSIAIASRGYHTLALRQDGTVWAWGYNNSGRLGDGTSTDRHSPVPIGGLTGHGGVTTLSGGGDVSAALMADHTLMAWGTNYYGAVGNGITSTLGQLTPTEVVTSTGLTYVKSIATGWDHMVALDQNGHVWTWGQNADGELGNGTIGVNAFSNVPILVNTSVISNVVGVTAGDRSTAVLTEDGHVWAWGSIRHGDGTPYAYGPSPVLVAGIDHVTLLRDRDFHILALREDGTVWAWGSNQRGECGNGTMGGNTDSPALVRFLSPAVYLPLIIR